MRKLLLILLFSSILSCSSKKGITKIDGNNINVLKSIISNSNRGIYYKTITEDLQKPLVNYLEPFLLEFSLCKKGIDSSIMKISKQEIRLLKKNFKNQSKIKLSQINIKFKNKVTKKRERFKTVYISMPIVFRNQTMAIYYSTGTYGGGFNLLKKENNKWERYVLIQFG